MSFTIENEYQNRMSLIAVEIICENKNSFTFVFYTSTFSGVYTHFESFYHLLLSLVLSTHLLIDVSRYAQVEVNYGLN